MVTACRHKPRLMLKDTYIGSHTHTSTHMNTDTSGLRHTFTHLHSRVCMNAYADIQRH
jgi:hypothetical protein